MSDRRLLLPAAQVEAVRAGRKTQHTLALKPQPPTDWSPRPELVELHRCDEWGEPVEPNCKRDVLGMGWTEDDGHFGFRAPCAAGDTYWLPEVWSEAPLSDHGRCFAYRATGDYLCGDKVQSVDPIRWRSPATMPRWAARTHVRVTGVSVERENDEWVCTFAFEANTK